MVDFSGSKQLCTINENAFGGTSDQEVLPVSFTKIYINNCNVSHLGEHLLDWLSLQQMGFTGNPWNCDCSMNWLFQNPKFYKFNTGKDTPL